MSSYTNLSTELNPSDVASLVSALGEKDWEIRSDARRYLVEIGEPAIGPLLNALRNPRQIVRWEAAKALEEIADPASAEGLVAALEDDDGDVRWLAAKGLVAIGREGLIPLLEALLERSESEWLCEGAHHILHDQRKADYGRTIAPVLGALDRINRAPAVSRSAFHALNQLKPSNRTANTSH